MTTHRATPLDMLAKLAADNGYDLCLTCQMYGRQQAGTLFAPTRDAGDLSVEAAAACELLAAELYLGWALIVNGSRRSALVRSLMAARVTLAMLPQVYRDSFGRFALTVDEDGNPPTPPAFPQVEMTRYADQLQAYLDQNDHDDWVDPNAIAGLVADIHDYLVQTLLCHELFGDDPTDLDGLCSACEQAALDEQDW